MKNKKGITLIALIITIIVMLILVGVTVNVALNGGLFDTTKEASKQKEKSIIYDQIVSAMNVTNNGNINVKGTYEDAKEILTAQGKTVALVEPVSEDSITNEAKFKVTGKHGTFEYQITETEIKDSENNGPETPTPPPPTQPEAQTLAEIIEPMNYGDPIEYSANGVEDWKVFYNDGTNVFIITSDCIPYEKVPTSLGLTQNGTKGVYWENPEDKQSKEVATTVANKFKADWVNYITDSTTVYEDVTMAADLLDTTAWSGFVSTEMRAAGALAIGGPTAEMWVESWNAKGIGKYPVLYDVNFGTYKKEADDDYNGYGEYRVFVWGSEDLDDSSATPLIASSTYTEAYNDSLYFLNTGYYGSSPAKGVEYDSFLFGVYTFANNRYIWTAQADEVISYVGEIGLRPVVCLPANAVATLQNGTWTNLGLVE